MFDVSADLVLNFIVELNKFNLLMLEDVGEILSKTQKSKETLWCFINKMILLMIVTASYSFFNSQCLVQCLACRY
jgi:hypothetical protein